MDFDFNWILVPATVAFFFLWLLDKLVFKQTSQQKQKKQDVLQADQKLQQTKQSFEQLKSKYPHLTLSDAVANLDEPPEVTQSREQISQAQLGSIRAHTELSQHKINPIITWAYDFWPVLAVVLVVRSFLYEPFNIPSESMNPTLETGDFILVNKYAYGVRLPLLNAKVLDTGSPDRGEVAVFRYPENPSISYIKRIIGIPGDKIVFRQGVLYINGDQQPYHLGNAGQISSTYLDQTGAKQSVTLDVQRWVVNIGEHRFISQYIPAEQKEANAQVYVDRLQQKVPLSLNQEWEVIVPEGQYFALGDNRDQSADSRFWGFVPEKNLTGRAMYIWMHKAPGLNLPKFNRNGRIL